MAFRPSTLAESAFGSTQAFDETLLLSDARESMYVTLFEEMLSAVLNHEIHLFSDAELAVFQAFRDLSYHARFLLIRLVLRKQGCWFRQCKLEEKYASDLGSKVLDTMKELWTTVITDHPRDSTSSAASSCEAQSKNVRDISISRFATSDEEATIDELLDCLALEEIKTLAKNNHVWSSNMTVRQLKEALRKHTSTQSTLTFAMVIPKNNSFVPSSSNFTVKDGRLRNQILKLTSRCIRIHQDVRRLFNRVNMIYLRSTNPVEVENLLLPCVLNKTQKRRYPEYEHNRTTTIFPSRESMLAYEEALMLEGELDIIYGGGVPQRAKKKDANSDNSRFAKSRKIRDRWEVEWEPWKRLVAENENRPPRLHGLERFEAGHIMTRIMYKGADALGALGEYELEIEVLKALLEQTRWRKGSRGAWWERLALIHHKHLDGAAVTLREAMRLLVAGLEDPLTHHKYRPTLERRLQALENRLKVPKEKRYKELNKQRKQKDRYIEGERIWESPEDDGAERDRRALKEKRQPSAPISKEDGVLQQKRKALIESSRKKGKSIWKGREDEELTVEEFSLQHYETLGYKGVHAEGSAMGTLFALLFWDILFIAVPGAFETAYQTAPLDLWEDSFYISRREAIELRLKEIACGEAWNIVRIADERERPKQTWCIGLKWELFTSDDLMHITQCIEGKVLSDMCRLLAEDYSLGLGGVPDLFIWNCEQRTAMFVEVKGPGDTLSETQKVWIDLLVRCGMEVEVCKVIEEGDGAGDKAPEQTPENQRAAEVTPAPREVIEIESEDDPMEAVVAAKKKPESRRPSLKRGVASDLVVEVDGVAVHEHQLGPKPKKKRSAVYRPGTL